MRRSLFFLLILFIFNGCQKLSQTEEDQIQAINRLEEICSQDFNGLLTRYGEECLIINPYNIVGEKVEESLLELDKYLQADKYKNEDVRSKIIELIEARLSPDMTQLSDEGFTDYEARFYSIIASSIVSDDIFTFNFRISCIEDLISNTKCLNLNAQKRLLVYCSVVKGITNSLYEMSSDRKPETWDDCFRKKQSLVWEGGILARLSCVVSWPACFGTMAADCVIEQIF
jgi:hypothetical protein